MVHTGQCHPLKKNLECYEWEMVSRYSFLYYLPTTRDLEFSKLTSNANFYKCGDDTTTKRHYLELESGQNSQSRLPSSRTFLDF